MYAGKADTNYVYKITKYNTTESIDKCPYFQSKGCYEGLVGPILSAKSTSVATNKPAFVVDREKWEKSNLATSLCKCAEIAKEEGIKFFTFNQTVGKKIFSVFSLIKFPRNRNI